MMPPDNQGRPLTREEKYAMIPGAIIGMAAAVLVIWLLLW